MITVKTQVISTLQSMNQWNLLLSFLMVLTERESVNLPLALFRMGGGGSAKRFSARFFLVYFFYQGFFFTDTDDPQDSREREGNHLLFHSTTSTRSQIFGHLFATLHVRWLSHIFNHIACIYQTATRWDLPPYRITIWLIDDVTLSFCLFTWWFDSTFFVTAIRDEKQVNSNSHRLSPLYNKRID